MCLFRKFSQADLKHDVHCPCQPPTFLKALTILLYHSFQHRLATFNFWVLPDRIPNSTRDSVLSLSPHHLSMFHSSVLAFSSSLSSLEATNQPEKRNRDINVYLKVPRTCFQFEKYFQITKFMCEDRGNSIRQRCLSI